MKIIKRFFCWVLYAHTVREHLVILDQRTWHVRWATHFSCNCGLKSRYERGLTLWKLLQRKNKETDCPVCKYTIPPEFMPEEPTDEGGAEFYCHWCKAPLYAWCNYGEFANQITLVEGGRI